MVAKRLTERVDAPFAGCRVDRAAGVIYGVKLCGFKSLNERDYLPEMFRRDFRKYENVPINFNHGRERRVEDVGGRVKNPRVDPDGTPRGDAHLLKTHPMYERVMEAAERDPGLFGFSHVAVCRTSPGPGGRERVEGLESVESVDLVAQPATTRGFFEDRNVKISLKKFAERFGPKMGPARWGALQKVCEDLGAMADAPVMEEPPAEADAGDLKAALIAALAPFIDEALDSGNADKAVAALKDFVKLHAKHTGKGGSDAPTEPPAGPDEEGRRRKSNALLEALDACDAAKVALCREDLELVAAAEPARRPALIERLKTVGAAAGAGAATATGKSRIDPSLTATTTQTATVTEGKPPADPKAFADWLK